jgi:hypothetical protein
MRRKVLLHGKSSLGICLPPQWTKNNDIEKGSEIELKEQENKIIISSINSIINKKTQINFENIDFNIQKEILNSLYEKGYDEITINYKNEKILKNIYIYLNEKNIGYEIINKESNYFIIKNISHIKEDQLNNLINRILKLLIEYSQKTKYILKDKNSLTITTLMHPKSIKKLSIQSKKIIITNNLKNGVYHYNLLKHIEKTIQQLNLFYNNIIKEDIIFNETSDIYKQINNCIIKIHCLFNNFSITKYSQIKNYLNDLNQQIKNIEIENILISDNIKKIVKNLENIFLEILYIQNI